MLSIQSLHAQVLDATTLDLSAGGYINDVVFDEYHDCYIVVGNFNTINGVTRKNIAFIDRATLAVKTNAYAIPVTDTDGEIRSVAITKTIVPLVSQTFHLYLGGNFTYITNSSGTYTRDGIIHLTSTQPLIIPTPPLPTFAASSWNADLDMTGGLTGYSSEGVDDILISGDTVMFSGKFYAVNSGTSYDVRDGMAAYTVSGTLLNYPQFSQTMSASGNRFFVMEKEGSTVYVGGYLDGGLTYKGRLYKLDNNGTIVPSFSFENSNLRCVYDVEFFEDSLFIVAEDRNAQNNQPDQIRIIRKSNGTEKTNHSLSIQPGENIGGIGNGKSSLAVYKNYVFTTSGQTGFGAYSYEATTGSTPVSGANWNANSTNNLTLSQNGKMFVVRNKLFISAANLATLSGQTRFGLGSYCLEPDDPKNFTAYDTTVCPEDVVTYTIPSVQYADGYKWEFTGTGALIDGSIPLISPVEFSSTTANSKVLTFESTMSPGVLKVTPYSLCNGSTKIYSNTISLSIQLNPLPHVNAGIDTSLTCARDTVVLYGYSDSVVVSHEWVYPFPIPNVFDQHDTITSPGEYIFKVVSPLGCPNFDTVHVWLDTLKPSVILPTGSYDLTCADPAKFFDGSSGSVHATVQWFDPVTSNYSPDPFLISAPGSYFLVATDSVNGCSKSEGILVENNFIIPNIDIVGYTSIPSSSELDTLTCEIDTLTLTVYSSTPLSTAEWMEADTSVFYGNTVNITEGGFYYIFATESTTGCTNSQGVFIMEYQNSLSAVAPEAGLLNCSNDSLVLTGYSLNAGANLEWNGPGISDESNPLVVHDPGMYYFTSTDPLTGCKAIDSTLVSEDHSIDIFVSNDSLVCRNSSAFVDVSYTGNVGGINYLWSNGVTSSSSVYQIENDSLLSVEVFGDGGCYGTDTIEMQIPPTPVIGFEGFKPCDDGPSGSVVATPISGLDPFTYSMDGTNFQSSPVFSNLFMGNYVIEVKDSLECPYFFTASIDENSNLPEPQFLVSTYNFETDTLVLIDVSNPKADSVEWLFPAAWVVLDDNVLSPMVLLPDTGTFVVTMKSWYGTCLTELSKTIYASEADSLAATMYNANGIKSLILYPNPTDGNFTVEVEFYKSQRAALVVQDMLGTTYLHEQFDESLLINYPVSLDGAMIDGTYVLKLVSEFDSAYVTFILAR